MNQPTFDFTEPIVARRMTDLDCLVEQIARDAATLKMDPTFWAPSREFYEERIAAYREAAREMSRS